MKKLFIVVLTSLCTGSFAQTPTDFDKIELDKKSDFKAADQYALEASVYLLSTPFEKDNITRLKALQFVIKWMSGTPDYTFTIDESAAKICKGNNDMLGYYMAAMTRYSLEHKETSKDVKKVGLNSILQLIDYCENPVNNFKMTKHLKKLAAANEKGQLEQEL